MSVSGEKLIAFVQTKNEAETFYYKSYRIYSIIIISRQFPLRCTDTQ